MENKNVEEQKVYLREKILHSNRWKIRLESLHYFADVINHRKCISCPTTISDDNNKENKSFIQQLEAQVTRINLDNEGKFLNSDLRQLHSTCTDCCIFFWEFCQTICLALTCETHTRNRIACLQYLTQLINMPTLMKHLNETQTQQLLVCCLGSYGSDQMNSELHCVNLTNMTLVSKHLAKPQLENCVHEIVDVVSEILSRDCESGIISNKLDIVSVDLLFSSVKALISLEGNNMGGNFYVTMEDRKKLLKGIFNQFTKHVKVGQSFTEHGVPYCKNNRLVEILKFIAMTMDAASIIQIIIDDFLASCEEVVCINKSMPSNDILASFCCMSIIFSELPANTSNCVDFLEEKVIQVLAMLTKISCSILNLFSSMKEKSLMLLELYLNPLLSLIWSLLSIHNKFCEQIIPLKWTSKVIYLCSIVSSLKEKYHENPVASTSLANTILLEIKVTWKLETVDDLLSQRLFHVLPIFSQMISKEEWLDISHVGKYGFHWCIGKLKFPNLGGDLLGRALALTCPLIDDLKDENQYLGLKILQHIIKNITDTELLWYSDVLLQIFEQTMYTRKVATLEILLACLLSTLVTVNNSSQKKDVLVFDRFFPRILKDMSLATEVETKIAYIYSMRRFILEMGMPKSMQFIRYLQPSLKVILSFSNSTNLELMTGIMITLKTVILCSWPRISSHVDEVLSAVLRVVVFSDVHDSASVRKEKLELLSLCEENILLLHQLCETSSEVLKNLTHIQLECKHLKPFCSKMIEKIDQLKLE